MATRKGLVKKTPLEAYRRPMSKGIIAIKIREDDELVDVVVTQPGDEVILSTKKGMAIRFQESDARAMGRNSSGVKGINLMEDDEVVGMVTAEPEGTLLTVCANGYGKRTPFGPGTLDQADADEAVAEVGETEAEGESEEVVSSQRSYRTQHRGGKGLRDIKTTTRNGPVIGCVRVGDDDELLMISARGKLQRIAASDVSIVGRNTQGVRIMSLDDDDTLVAVKRLPREESDEEETPPEQAQAGPSAGESE
jgi:DNA gyrase subunit A